MKIPAFIKDNILLKMTSLNAPVIVARMGVSFVITRLISNYFGEAGFHFVGQLRDLLQILTSTTSLGVFNGIVKYVAEYKEDRAKLNHLFSTTFVFATTGIVVSSLLLFFASDQISHKLFQTTDYSFLIKVVAIVTPFIGLQRVFNGVINGLSRYKQFVKIDLVSFLIGSGFTLVFAYLKDLDGVLLSIALIPIVQLLILVIIFFKELKEYIAFKELSFKIPLAKPLLAFALMSFFSTVIMRTLDIEIRSIIVDKIDTSGSGSWTSMTTLSKQYMSFSIMLFSMYVLPKFAVTYTQKDFFFEAKQIFKTLLPLFGAGMIVVYLLRDFIIELVFPGNDKEALEPLFKWQLMGDFLRLISMVMAYQFIAKKLVRTFIFTELLSLGLFYLFAQLFIDKYGVEGVVMGHFVRYIIYLIVVIFFILRYFKTTEKAAT